MSSVEAMRYGWPDSNRVVTALAPYIGMVAKSVFVPVDAAFFACEPDVQRAIVDRALARHFEERARFSSPRRMPPLPVLGVPGWYAPQDEAFYDDASYFRSRARAPRRMPG